MSALDGSEQQEVTPKSRRLWLHVLLFLLTLGTTTFVGLQMSEARAELIEAGLGDLWYTSPMVWLEGFSYALSILAILVAHEMGHYLTSRRFGVDASLPYFIPMISAFGTLGAFIRMRLDRKVPSEVLMKIGAYGPIAGFIVAVPVLVVGIMLSDVRPTPEDLEGGIILGDSLLLLGVEQIFFTNIPDGHDIWLHPMAFAGWAGLFVTALNLLPFGQLDGGHVAYCLFGDKYNRVAPYLFVGLIALTAFVFSGWLMVCILILFIGVEHPQICTDTPVRGPGRWIGVVGIVIMLLTFTPEPFVGMPTLFDLF